MPYLETVKTYTGNDVEKIFFRPMLTGPSAADLGIRVLYNLPAPTTVQYWSPYRNILQPLEGSGWNGGKGANKLQKTIRMERVKAELAFSAADYYSMVYETITAQPDVNFEDLTGTIIEQAETAIFKQNIAENLRVTMWIGDTQNAQGYNTFNGLLSHIKAFKEDEAFTPISYSTQDKQDPAFIPSLFNNLWDQLHVDAQSAKHEGQLAFFVTSDIYNLYEKYLDSMGVDAAYTGTLEGHTELMYHGIPVIDIRLSRYLADTSFDQSFALLTDRRNLILAVNTADMPGNEVRMWYNPDEMENRQRATFMAGTAILDESLFSYAHIL